MGDGVVSFNNMECGSSSRVNAISDHYILYYMSLHIILHFLRTVLNGARTEALYAATVLGGVCCHYKDRNSPHY